MCPASEPAVLPTEFEHYPLRTTRRGHFWISGERIQVDGGTVQRAPLYVEWEAPEQITRPYPLVLIHGGGGQLTDWRGTPDGRPGWMDRFVDDGYLVYVVDRPAHGVGRHNRIDIASSIVERRHGSVLKSARKCLKNASTLFQPSIFPFIE